MDRNIISGIILVCYVISSVIDIRASLNKGKRTFKVLLMPLLTLFYLTKTEQPELLLCAALKWGWLGDIFLIGKTTKMFFAGLLSFQIGHFFYIALFIKYLKPETLFLRYLFFVIPYLAAVLYLLKDILPYCKKKLKIPVVIYMGVILCMSYTAMLNFVTHLNLPSFFVWAGSLLFVISDTMIAYRNFRKRKDHGIMLTYVLAQLLIVTGFII